MQADMLSIKLDGRSARFRVAQLDDTLEVHDGCRRYSLKRKPAYAFEKTAAAKADAVRAPMPGRIVSVRAEVGAEGTELLVMEAMTMELSLKAPRAGKIAELRATVSDFVEADAVLVRLE